MEEDTTIHSGNSLTLSSCRRLQIAVLTLVIFIYFTFIAHVMFNTVLYTQYKDNEVTTEPFSSYNRTNHKLTSEESNTLLSVLNVLKPLKDHVTERNNDHLSSQFIRNDKHVSEKNINDNSELNNSDCHKQYGPDINLSKENFSHYKTTNNCNISKERINVKSILNNSEPIKDNKPRIVGEDMLDYKTRSNDTIFGEDKVNVFSRLTVLDPHKNYHKRQPFQVYQKYKQISTNVVLPLFCNGSVCLSKCCSTDSEFYMTKEWTCDFHKYNDTSFGISVQWTKRPDTLDDVGTQENKCKLYITTKYADIQLRLLNKGSILIKHEWFDSFCYQFGVVADFFLVYECGKKINFESVSYDGIYEELDDSGNYKINVSGEDKTWGMLSGYVTAHLEEYKNTYSISSYLYIAVFVMMALSTICMIAIILIYFFTPQLLTNNGKIIILYLASVLIHNLTLFSGKFYAPISKPFIEVLNRASQFSWITWMTIMCFDIWSVFSKPLASHPHLRQMNGKFKYYFIVATGNIVLHLLVYTIIDDLSVYDRENLEFTKVGVILNTFMFLATLFNMRFHKSNITFCKPQRDSPKDRLRMYTKLFLLMGLDWLLAVVCFETGGYTISLVGVMIVELQGIILFILLVCNKRVLRLKFKNINTTNTKNTFLKRRSSSK